MNASSALHVCMSIRGYVFDLKTMHALGAYRCVGLSIATVLG